MNLLIIQQDLFNFQGGGETVYTTIIRSNPEFTFYYFVSDESIFLERPTNAIPISLGKDHIYKPNSTAHISGEDFVSMFRAADFIREQSQYTFLFEKNIVFFLDWLISLLPPIHFEIGRAHV